MTKQKQRLYNTIMTPRWALCRGMYENTQLLLVQLILYEDTKIREQLGHYQVGMVVPQTREPIDQGRYGGMSLD